MISAAAAGEGELTRALRHHCYPLPPSPIQDKWGHLGVLQADGEVAGFHPHVRPITSIVVHPRDPAKVLTCSYDGTARMMDVDAGRFTEVTHPCHYHAPPPT